MENQKNESGILDNQSVQLGLAGLTGIVVYEALGWGWNTTRQWLKNRNSKKTVTAGPKKKAAKKTVVVKSS